MLGMADPKREPFALEHLQAVIAEADVEAEATNVEISEGGE